MPFKDNSTYFRMELAGNTCTNGAWLPCDVLSAQFWILSSSFLVERIFSDKKFILEFIFRCDYVQKKKEIT